MTTRVAGQATDESRRERDGFEAQNRKLLLAVVCASRIIASRQCVEENEGGELQKKGDSSGRFVENLVPREAQA